MPLTPEQLYTGGTAPTWVAQTGDDFLYRVYFDAPATPTPTIVDAGFTLGSGRGFAVTSSDTLTTDARIAAVLVADDTASSGWSDPIDIATSQGARAREFPQFIQRIFDRTSVTLNGSSYYPSFGDFWIFQDGELERTDGFDNQVLELTQFSSSLSARGKASNLFETASIALSGVQPQSLVDAIIKEDDEFGNRSRCQEIIAYLSRDSSRNLLRLGDIITYYNSLPFKTQVDNSYWNLSADTLQNYPEPRQFLVEYWSKGFTPVAFLVADGDDDGRSGMSASDVVLSATGAWQDNGINVHSLALGTSNSQAGIRTVSSGTGGRLFLLGSGDDNSDWDNACSSFLHGGDNSLFVSRWGRTFDYESPVWVRQINATYAEPTRTDSSGVNSSCLVQVRWSKNRSDFTPWRTVTSGTPLMVEDLIVVLEYAVVMTDGWSAATSGAPLCPVVSALNHTTVDPSIKYFITLPQDVAGLPVEYLLTANVNIPPSARLTWGLCRGDSRDFADFEPIRSSRIGMMSNRQYCLQYTDTFVRSGLTTQMLDTAGLLYQVIDTDGASPATWASDDEVMVYGNDTLIVQSQYTLDSTHGIVNFLISTLGATITVTVTRPSRVYDQVGESTSTVDRRTYFLSNSRFPKDSRPIVLVNGAILRGGWHASPEDGVVVFDKELESTDIVTVFIMASGLYRVGAELQNYGTSDVTLEDFALFYSAVDNQSLLFELNNTPIPALVENSLIIQPVATLAEPHLPTVYERLWIDYQFFSRDGNKESGTTTSWWLKRTGDATIWPLGVDEDGFHEITADNGLPEYRNRMTEKRENVGPAGGLFLQGDQVRVRVTPSDGFTTGAEIISPVVTLSGTKAPYLDPNVALNILSAESSVDLGSGITYVKAGYSLTATYSQIDPDGGPDLSIVRWYRADALQPFAQGPSIPAGVTLSGQTINFTVQPFDGQMTGTTAQSGYVKVR